MGFFLLPCICYAFVCVFLYVLCGHLLGKGWPLGSRLWCLAVRVSFTHWYPGSGVVLDCIDSWSLHPYLLLLSSFRNMTGKKAASDHLAKSLCLLFEASQHLFNEINNKIKTRTNMFLEVLIFDRYFMWLWDGYGYLRMVHIVYIEFLLRLSYYVIRSNFYEVPLAHCWGMTDNWNLSAWSVIL